MFMIVVSEKLIWKFCETISWRTFKKSMVNVTASYSQKHFLLKDLSIIIRPLPCWQHSLLFAGSAIKPQIYHATPCPAVLVCKGV